MSEKLKEEIIENYLFFKEVQSKINFDFIAKFIGLNLSEKYLVFITEDEKICFYDYIIHNEKISLEELHFYVLNFINYLTEISEILEKNPSLLESKIKLNFSKEKIKIFFEYDKGGQVITNFFRSLDLILKQKKNSQNILVYKEYLEILNKIIHSNLININEINTEFKKLDIKVMPPNNLQEEIENSIQKQNECESSLNSAIFFDFINNDDQMKCYTIKTLVDKTNLEHSSHDDQIEALELLMKIPISSQTRNPEEKTIDLLYLQNSDEKQLKELAIHFKDVGDNKRAEECFLKTLEILEKEDSEKNLEEEIVLLNNLGGIYYNQLNFKKAKDFYEKAIAKNTKSPNLNENLGKNFNNLGLIHKKMNNHKKAEELYLKSLDFIEKMPKDKNSKSLATIYNNLGGLYHNMKQFSKAKGFYEKSFEIFLSNFNENSFNLAQNLNNIGTVYKEMGEFSKSKVYLEKSLEMYSKINPKDSYDKTVCLNNLGLLFYQMKEKNKSIEYLEKANRFWAANFGEKYELYLENLIKIKELNSNLL